MLNQVSIVIPTLERPHMLERSIGSCLGQTVPPLEVLVVDNGDHPGTIEIVEKLNRNKSGIGVRRLASEKGNLSKALTLGFESAQGDWTIHLDDDDL
ncbi:glycosyltransferase, partial [Puniceicoccaceae bacterium]|nr:glycosyltransferase [Puniceicoccaceae bacterium]